MAQRCTICAHKQRVAIDAAILAGEANTRIGSRFGVDEASVRYHTAHHLREQVKAARVWSTQQIAEKLQALDAHAQDVLAAAKASGDHRLRLSGIEVAGRNLERVAKIAGVQEDLDALQTRLAALEAERVAGAAGADV